MNLVEERVMNYERKITAFLAGTSQEPQIPVMVSRYRNIQEYIVPKEIATKEFLDAKGVSVVTYAAYLNVAREIAAAIMGKGFAGVYLKNYINNKIEAKWTAFGLVQVTIQELCLNVFGVPLV